MKVQIYRIFIVSKLITSTKSICSFLEELIWGYCKEIFG